MRSWLSWAVLHRQVPNPPLLDTKYGVLRAPLPHCLHWPQLRPTLGLSLQLSNIIPSTYWAQRNKHGQNMLVINARSPLRKLGSGSGSVFWWRGRSEFGVWPVTKRGSDKHASSSNKPKHLESFSAAFPTQSRLLSLSSTTASAGGLVRGEKAQVTTSICINQSYGLLKMNLKVGP